MVVFPKVWDLASVTTIFKYAVEEVVECWWEGFEDVVRCVTWAWSFADGELVETCIVYFFVEHVFYLGVWRGMCVSGRGIL